MNLYHIIESVFSILEISLLIRVLISWIPHDPDHPIVSFLYAITDPIMKPFRQLIPAMGGIDLSPIFAFIALGILKQVIVRILL